MSSGLSARQEECLRLTAFLTDQEIAARLGLSETTVKKHVHEACRRLGVNRRKAGLALLERSFAGQDDEPGGPQAPAQRAPAPAPAPARRASAPAIGYRPPPRHRGFRLLMVLLATVLCAILLKAVADLVISYSRQAGEIGQISLQDR